MNNLSIFCEGVTDQLFLADCLEFFYGFKFERNFDPKKIKIFNKSRKIEIIDVGGCTKLSNDLYLNQLKDNIEYGIRNVVIFDADTTGKTNGNKGFKACTQKLNNIKKNNGVDFEFFIWPNHKDDGIIENLLKNLIPANKMNVYNCIESHQICLSSLSDEKIRIADLKEKIGYYLFTCNSDSNVKKRNYKDTDFWNLDLTNTELIKLKTFLDSFVSEI
jgi:hypothetical protein